MTVLLPRSKWRLHDLTCICQTWNEPYGPDHPLWILQQYAGRMRWISCENCGRIMLVWGTRP